MSNDCTPVTTAQGHTYHIKSAALIVKDGAKSRIYSKGKK